jgi:hypothetical protein
MQNMKAARAGHLFLSRCQMFLKKKRILILVIQEQSIIVKNVAAIMAIYLMMGRNLQEKDIVIMARAYLLE